MIIGTAGHIDHGKTALVRALTGIDTDRLKEEKARGITIDLGFAYLPLPDGRVLGFVDVPGHEKFIHNMLAGATGIDFMLLVVAADDGVMPQTREHLAIVDLLGLSHGIVALTKCDLADEARRRAVAADVATLLAATGLNGAAIMPVSTVTGEGLAPLRAALEAAAAAFHERSGEGRFRLAIDRSFALTGAGTIVTGTVLSGSVAVGDRITLSPSGRTARVRAIHAQNRAAETGQAGQRCALNLAGDGIVKEAIHRGDVALDPALHAPADRIDASLRVLRSEPRPLGQWMPVRLHHGAVEIAARLVLLGDGPVAPGGEALVQLVLEHPIAAAAGDPFVLRDTSAQRTIGGGRFLDLRAPARKRRTPERLAQLAALALIDPERILAALTALPGAAIDIATFARDHALSAAQMERIAGRLGLIGIAVPGGTLAFAPAEWLRLKHAVAAALADYHAANPDLSGIGRERLRLAVAPRLAAPAFAAVLHNLARPGDIVLDGSWVRLHGHEVRLTQADAAAWNRMHGLLGGRERFRPPRVRDIGGLLNMPEVEIRRILKLAGRMGKVDEVAHDHFFLRGTVAEMVGIMIALAARSPGGEFNAASFRDQFDNGRKVAIQILEFFDRHGVTLRRGDLRRLNRHRLDLFGAPPEVGPQVQPETAVDPLQGREASPVGRPDFKSGRGRATVSGGFDSHSLPPPSRSAR